jgi:hypothetical protein
MSNNRIRLGLSTLAFAGLISVGAASAQAPSSPPAPNLPSATTAPSSASSTVADVEKWTTDEWEAAKAKWSGENAKWRDCEQQATDQKLAGRQSCSSTDACFDRKGEPKRSATAGVSAPGHVDWIAIYARPATGHRI